MTQQLLREAHDRGHANFGWLDSRHTFSFGRYYDPEHMGFRALRVINDDRVTAGAGFGQHPHDNMEIISYVVEGALEHKDSMGTGSVIRSGDVQLMSAGTGVTHSEFNASSTEPVRFLQIWLPPATRGLKPSYQQRHFAHASRTNALRLIVSPDGADDSLKIHRDVRILGGLLDPAKRLTYETSHDRHTWLQIVKGELIVNETTRLQEGDGLAMIEAEEIFLEGGSRGQVEFLVFDLD